MLAARTFGIFEDAQRSVSMPGNLSRVTQSSAESGEMKFWLSEMEQLGEDDDEWGSRSTVTRTFS